MNKRLLIIIMSIAVIVLINFYPTMNLGSAGTESIETNHFVLYFGKNDQTSSIEMSRALETAYEKIIKGLTIKPQNKTEVYIYPNLAVFHSKKYGFIGRIISPDWYVGDNIGEKVIIVTPRDPGSQNSYDTVLAASVHEFVHTLIFQINNKCPYWLDNGLATYFAGQKPNREQLENISLADLNKIRTENPIKFGQVNGYEYSYAYIDFLNEKYGMQKIMKLVKAPNEYKSIFGKSLKQLDEEFTLYMRNERRKLYEQ